MSDRPLPRSPMVESAIRREDDRLTHIERINGPDIVWAPGLPAVADQHTIEEQAAEAKKPAKRSRR